MAFDSFEWNRKKTQENKHFLKRVVTLGIPIVLQQVVGLGATLIANLMVGSLGDVSVSACSIATSFYMLFSLTTGGLVNGASILTAQAWGEKDTKKIKRMFSIVLLLSTIVSLLFFGAAQLFAEKIVAIYTTETILIAPTSAYLRMISYAFLPHGLSNAIVVLMLSVENVKIGFVSAFFNCITNVLFNWMFIFGNCGCQPMGINGAALGTFGARMIEFLLVVIYLFCIEKKLSLRISDLWLFPKKPLLLHYWQVGWPVLISDAFMMVNSTLQTMITGRISTSYITANSIVHMIWQFGFLFMMGVSGAAGIMIGGDIGKERLLKQETDKPCLYETVQKDAERFVIVSIILGILAGISVLIIGPIFIQLYDVSVEAKRMAADMTKAASISVFFMAIQIIVTKGVIRAGGKTKKVLWVDLLSCYMVGIPLGYFCAIVLRLSPFVVYIALRSDYIVKAVWGVIMIQKNKWIIMKDVNVLGQKA